jgi:lysophospholipase L1-like esterase
MKKHIYKSGMLALFAGVLFTSCDPEIDTPNPSSGGVADFSTYIAVGNSLTAGYQDNGLYRDGQLNSFPAIMADQFKLVGGGDFTQPLFTEEQKNGSGYLKLTGFNAQGSPITAPVTDQLAVTRPNGLLTKYNDPVQNLGVPDIRVADITSSSYSSVNPYYERITPDTSPNQTYLERVAATDHTFFSMWLGNNDVLLYATSGGAFSGGVLNSDFRTITPTNTFDANYSAMLNALTADGQKGIVGTVPSVEAVPFFTTVGPAFKQSLDANSIPGFVALTGGGRDRIQVAAAQINAPENGVLIPLTASAYAPLLAQPTGKYWRDLARQVSPSKDGLVVRGTLVSLLAAYQIDTTQMFGLSRGNPWPSALLLDMGELTNIKIATEAFNGIIRAQAESRELALFDANQYFLSIQNGFANNNVAYSPAYISGNLFSLDGVHPTPRGYAIIANEMIKAINAKYNANIPTVDETQYRAVLFP